MAEPRRRNLDALPSDTSGNPARDRLWLALIILGIVIRFGVAGISIGANDANVWLNWGVALHLNGLFGTYHKFAQFNHPPIPAYWAMLCAKVARYSADPPHDWIFALTFKLAPILGDCLGIFLLYRIWSRARSEPESSQSSLRLLRARLSTRNRTHALYIAAMFSLSINAIAVSAYHCNTDSLLIALCLLCLYFLDGNAKPFFAGLALAGAINIKLIPVVLILPLLLQMRSWKDAAKFVGGLAVGVIPFLPILLNVRADFIHNALQYNSFIERWGVNYFFLLGKTTLDPHGRGEQLSAAFYGKARYLILGLIALWSIAARLKPRWSLAEIVVVTFAILLIFAPGFGVQYTVLIGLPLFVARPRWAVAYGLVAGAFVTSAYFVYLTDNFPYTSEWAPLFPEPVATIGLVTWFMLIVLLGFIVIIPARGEMQS